MLAGGHGLPHSLLSLAIRVRETVLRGSDGTFHPQVLTGRAVPTGRFRDLGHWRPQSAAKLLGINSSYLQIKVKAMKAREAHRRERKHPALSDWRELQDGERVNILRNAKIVAQGRVEEVSESGGVLWIVNDQSQNQAFFKSDGVLVHRS